MIPLYIRREISLDPKYISIQLSVLCYRMTAKQQETEKYPNDGPDGDLYPVFRGGAMGRKPRRLLKLMTGLWKLRGRE